MPHPIRATWLTRPGWSEFGAWRKSGGHKGFDYYCPEETPIYGTGPGGRVAHIGSNMSLILGFGHSVRIAYPGSRVTIDAHMSRRTPLAYGQSVDENTVVGYVGKTGNAFRTVWVAIYNGVSRALRHDHHEVTVRGVLVDPIALYGPAFADTPTRSRENPMSIIKKTEKGTEWCLFAPLMSGPVTAAPDQLGRRVTTYEPTARMWADMYGIPFDSIPVYAYDPYIQAQKEGEAIMRDILRRLPSSGGNVDQKPILEAIAALPGQVVSALAAWFKRP